MAAFSPRWAVVADLALAAIALMATVTPLMADTPFPMPATAMVSLDMVSTAFMAGATILPSSSLMSPMSFRNFAIFP